MLRNVNLYKYKVNIIKEMTDWQFLDASRIKNWQSFWHWSLWKVSATESRLVTVRTFYAAKNKVGEMLKRSHRCWHDLLFSSRVSGHIPKLQRQSRQYTGFEYLNSNRIAKVRFHLSVQWSSLFRVVLRCDYLFS